VGGGITPISKNKGSETAFGLIKEIDIRRPMRGDWANYGKRPIGETIGSPFAETGGYPLGELTFQIKK